MMDQRSEIAQGVFSEPPSGIFITQKFIINTPDDGSEIRDCSGSFLSKLRPANAENTPEQVRISYVLRKVM